MVGNAMAGGIMGEVAVGVEVASGDGRGVASLPHPSINAAKTMLIASRTVAFIIQ